MSDPGHRDAILAAYARYDGDQRVSGLDDFEAFHDAVLPLLAPQLTGHEITQVLGALGFYEVIAQAHMLPTAPAPIAGLREKLQALIAVAPASAAVAP